MGIFQRMRDRTGGTVAKAEMRGAQCPHCGSDDVGLIAPDFETAKCQRCKKSFQHPNPPRPETRMAKSAPLDGYALRRVTRYTVGADGTVTPERDQVFAKARDVKNPGSRGGKFRRTKSGKLRYGGQPTGGTKVMHRGQSHDFTTEDRDGGDEYEYGHIRTNPAPIPGMDGQKGYWHGYRHKGTGEFHSLGSEKAGEIIKGRQQRDRENK